MPSARSWPRLGAKPCAPRTPSSASRRSWPKAWPAQPAEPSGDSEQLLRTSAIIPAIAGLVLAVAVVGLHLRALGPDPSVFVRAAPPLADPLRVPHSLQIMRPEQAYDGEFFYRLALDPLLLRDVGITLDGPSYRQQRLLYPILVRDLSLGQDAWVPWLLILVNVAGLTVLGFLGARYAIALG